MPKTVRLFCTAFLILTAPLSAQVYESGWVFGIGFSYPRYVRTDLKPLDINYGGFFSLQRNFNEHTALRLKISYRHLEGEDEPTQKISKSDLFEGGLSLVNYFFPCEPVSPYISAGISNNFFMLKNKITRFLNKTYTALQYDFAAGAEWRQSPVIKIITEIGYHAPATSNLDGLTGESSGGSFKGKNDSFFSFDVGIVFYLGTGDQSELCEPCAGVKKNNYPEIDYDRIERLIKNNLPREITKEVIVEKPVEIREPENWVLVGVNFETNSDRLTAGSAPALLNAVKVLSSDLSIKVEIQGHTDNVGPASLNKELSVKRARAVLEYLVSRGISRDRLDAVGYGEEFPVADNRTSNGRALNRRIEFKVIKN